MRTPRRLLLVEDDDNDAELLRRQLSAQWPNCEFAQASNREDFVARLNEGGFDVIVSDYAIPGFEGLSLLGLAREKCPDIPFLFVSGAIRDEVAIESLKAGATDYVLKDRLARLVPAIQRALNEAEESAQRKLAEERLRQSEEQYRDLFENATDLIQSSDPHGHYLYVNRAWRHALGYTKTEVAELSIWQVLHPEYHLQWQERFERMQPDDESRLWEAIFLTKFGQQVFVEGNIGSRFVNGEHVATRGIFRDVTEKKLTAVALMRSVRQHETLINSVDGIVWQAELPDLRFRYVSQQAERLLGYPAQRWLDEPRFWQDHIHPDDRERAVRLCTGLPVEQRHMNFEYRMLAADGRVVWLRDIVSLRAEDGEAPLLHGIMVDITRRKLAEAAQRESEVLKGAIMEAALDCIIVMNEEGKIIEFNQATERTFGYPRSEILGQLLAKKLLPAALQEGHEERMKQCVATAKGPGLGKRTEMMAMHADGSEFPAELAVISIPRGEGTVLTVYLRDITERKRAEARVRRIQKKLKRTNQDLLARHHEIQSFYHTLSHELKTPLTSAREFISIVSDGLAGSLNQTQLEYLGIARQSCDQLQRCINDLLDTTRLETGKLALELKPVSLADLVQRVVATMSPTASEKGLTLRQELQTDLPEASMDEHRITQVITNLLNNAIKYTPAGGEIVTSAREAPDRPELLQVSIRDTGRGIAREEHERIFERLYQVKAGDATTELGVGLGLYLCRELVQLHGGTIWVESEPGQGSTFSFVLPKRQQALFSNLLIIDDDPDALEMLRHLLVAEQYNVRTARDGAEGLEEMRRQPPDIVLLDLAMPRLNGPATLKEIRHHWGSIPVIVHTGFADGELMKQALAFSPFTLLAKPCGVNQVLETVRKVQRAGDTAIWKRNHYDLQKPRFQ